ncbi:Flagellum site-determining protein YlxH [Candidatus Izimaplasma bacterium HR1]|jgi:ATP-binding protein involved in chromosome partitioning|uniref:P-loop NTPase n=1 Tax=Candidatus Izimoplasma sp. HR1 TaxID=1541959 RepID=UPI0004F73220|nr:Flagellum site-determining protein YlxH [Candidatus Izimaplasma bacterium HR1]
MMTKEQVIERVLDLKDPSSDKTLRDSNGVKHLAIDEEKKTVTMVIGLDKDDDEFKRNMTRDLARLLKIELGFTGIKTEYQLNKLSTSILSREVRYVGVASGKGGVGKSTVTANLAYALKRLGKNVGIIDADIYGSSIPTILDMEITPPKGTKDEKIIPYNVDGIELISTEFFLTPDKPLMWRGPMLGKMLNHFFYDVIWDDNIEYILVDLPPGTGDVALDIQKLIPSCKMLIVTTPHPSASHIAVKAGFAAEQLEHEILGIVENMSYFRHKGEDVQIFGSGGGKIVADKLKTRVLSSIPIGQPKNSLSIFGADEEIGIDYLGLANKIVKAY